jgi:hypothetical protein
VELRLHFPYFTINFPSSYLLTYGAEPFLRSCKVCSHLRIPSILWNPKVHYRVHKSPPLVPILSHIDPAHTIPSYLSKILLYLSILLHSRILHAQYIQSLMQLKILFILILTRHVSAEVDHHQVFLLKLFHCNLYI